MKQLGILLLLLPALVGCEKTRIEGPAPIRTFEWSDEIVDLMGELPLQEDGRVKPFSVFAGFQMLKTNGKRTLKVDALAPEDKLDPVRWILDCLFFPEQAREYPSIIVDNSAVLDAIGVKPHAKKRDRYSYAELEPAREVLRARALQATNKDRGKREEIDTQILALWSSFSSLEALFDSLDFTGPVISAPSSIEMRGIFGTEAPSYSEVLAAGPEIVRIVNDKAISEEAKAEIVRYFGDARTVGEFDQVMRRVAGAIAIFPPAGTHEQNPEWRDAADLANVMLVASGEPETVNLDAIRTLERMKAARLDPETLLAEARVLNDDIVGRADARGEYSSVPKERFFYKFGFFWQALYLFAGAFIVIAFSWLRPAGKTLVRIAWALCIAAEVMLVSGIVLRSMIRELAPVSTLYDTIVFIAATAVGTAFFLEWVTRRRVALSVAAFMGMFLMFMAHRFEVRAATLEGDTMPSLVAVLRTNFWLATHVTSITLGYSAGLLASVLAHVWIVASMFSGKFASGPRRDLLRDVSRMVYGVLCFSLLFSVVGTILGGIWANYSWGRFWGWDPKENGALMICLWQILTLHARLAGFIKNRGLAIMTIMGGIVIAFSWWHVNHLEIGLHTYGKVEKIVYWLTIFYTIEVGFLAIAGVWALATSGRGKPGSASTPQTA